ncbi:MAG: ATP synthase F1 subunit epsilon [Dysgonamonadaceae bacterium]|jgi:F-type H+-transporting ATPase subunit epsilon|nr:ATP synthase F1 subunit epsilon [Dysgonamonadaceae bacterium]
MKIEIISPEKIIYSGEADSVTLPGVMGSFSILNLHAPIISILKKGALTYRVRDNEKTMEINSGFVETKKNIVTVCVE